MKLHWGRPTRKLVVFHDEAYGYPLGIEHPTGIDARRADLALWYLLEKKALHERDVRAPAMVEYADLARVHEAAYLESLSDPTVLARIFALEVREVPVDEVLRTVRLACGGTVAAARHVLEAGGSALNVLGGFHHAGVSSGGGFCAVNDVAVAVALVRQDGFQGKVAVVDVDAHPPDGTAECLRADAGVWIGSLSGSKWGDLPGVDETVLPEGTADAAYLKSLEALLGRLPKAQLAFVNAGGDVLAGDRLGKLGLSLDGVRRRDVLIRDALGSVPSVWLPAGGYGPGSWKALAGTGLVLAGWEGKAVSDGFDPLRARFTRVSRQLGPAQLTTEDSLISSEELEDVLHVPHAGKEHFLGYYSREGLEYALSRYGVWQQIQRQGYTGLRLELGQGADGERLRLQGTSAGVEHCLVDVVLERKTVEGTDYLFVNWLSLRNPRAVFSDKRPALPGQEVPGLGVAREVGLMLGLMARRLGLTGVAFCPSWYHMAYAGRHVFRFLEPERQGRFEALVQSLKQVPLVEATRAVADGRVRLEGAPYAWEPTLMVQGPAADSAVSERVARAREAAHFALVSSA